MRRGLSRLLVAIGAVLIALLMVASILAYFLRLRPSGPVSPPSPQLLSQYLGGNWSLNPNRSYLVTFDTANDSALLRYLNGTTVPRKINGTYASEFMMPGPDGGPDGGLPAWIRVYTFMGRNGTYVVFEVFKANSTQITWTLQSLERRFGSPSDVNGVEYYVETPYAPLLRITYVYAIYGDYLIVVGTNLTSPGPGLGLLVVKYALSLP